MIWKPHLAGLAVIPNVTITIASKWSTDSLVKDSCSAWDTALFYSYISAAGLTNIALFFSLQCDSQKPLTITR